MTLLEPPEFDLDHLKLLVTGPDGPLTFQNLTSSLLIQMVMFVVLAYLRFAKRMVESIGLYRNDSLQTMSIVFSVVSKYKVV